MEFKGTKGRWSIYHRIDDNEENQYSVTSNNGKVCNCYKMSIPDYENKIAMANAQLISKSPILLQAIYDSIKPLKDAGLKEMADYHEKIYIESINIKTEATELK